MDKYAIRRAIIRALYDFQNPQDLGAILSHHALILAACRVTLTDEDIVDVRREWDYLTEKGYLAPVPGYDGYRKLSGELRSVLDAADRLGDAPPALAGDERLYGPGVLGR